MNHVCSSLLSDNPDPDLYFIFPLIPSLQSNDDCDNAKDGNDDGPDCSKGSALPNTCLSTLIARARGDQS